MRKVPFFDYPGIYTRFKGQFDQIFQDVCSRGAFILQKDLAEFEAELAEFLNVKHVLGVADGTNAMYLGLQALGIGVGDEVIISSHTYVATANAIQMVGASPIFADIDENYLLCPAAAASKITNKTRAIMPTQLNGRCANMDGLRSLAEDNQLVLAEDSAQGLGARYGNEFAGTFGSFGTLSFYPAKLIGCFGDGGAIMTNDDALAEKMNAMRDHGRDANGEVTIWGTNSRLDNLQAAFLRLRLKHFGEDMERRREIAGRYQRGLGDLSEMGLPPSPNDSSPHFDVFQNYECTADRRDELRQFLQNKGIGTLIQWGGVPVHHFEGLGYGKEKFTDLSNTDKFFERCLMLPMNMSLTNDDIDYVIESIIGFYLKDNKQ
ncbi:MAG: DegT/DnrJ/EryC1/StrS family aminotransferase [Pseudohongiellaceae bacterium]